MPEYRRARVSGGTYFFTVVTYNRYPFFADESAIILLHKCFQIVASEYPYTMDACVILPDHIHCIWTLPDNGSDFSTRWKLIKTTFTKNYSGSRPENVSESMLNKGERGIWQRRFWEHMIRDQEDFNRHCDYIHYNPVRHGYVKLPMEWKHSSFREFAERGLYPQNWGHAVSKEVIAMDFE
ncbi:MAG: transposase [Chloroflexi bacterium]|nr:transposase [Chloroflexota bacterium]